MEWQTLEILILRTPHNEHLPLEALQDFLIKTVEEVPETIELESTAVKTNFASKNGYIDSDYVRTQYVVPSVSTMVRHQLPNSLMYEGGEKRSHVNVVECNESFCTLGLKHSSVSSGGGE